MRNSLSQFQLTESLQDIGVKKKYPQYCFVKAKHEMNAIFGDLREYIELCNKFLTDTRIADENEQDIKEFSSEVRLSNVAFKLYDIDENWQI